MSKSKEKKTALKRMAATYMRVQGVVTGWVNYAMRNVWNDQRSTFGVNLVKTVNLSVRSFLNSDLQMRASALTYQTILAIVPALALLFAIGRGFGFQNLLQTELFRHFPAQQQALEEAFKFVDSYLAQSSEGIFVGIGILFLLWTLVSLISSVEDSFNSIWTIKQGRSLWRKITDYTAIVLILPVIMICSSGITVMMSTALRTLLPFAFLSPIVGHLLDFLSLALIWLFFAGTYMLVPNTKVKFKNALIAGVIAGTGFAILEWLFVSGQVYVTRYNAIYGSFAFLPLLLIWLQLVWTITLSGAVVCYSSQNIFEFSFDSEISHISSNYRWRIMMAVVDIAVQRFVKHQQPLSPHQIAVKYSLPVQLVTNAVDRLVECGILLRVVTGRHSDAEPAVAPALEPELITVGLVIERMGKLGSSDFIPHFDTHFGPLTKAVIDLRGQFIAEASQIKIKDLEIESKKTTK